MVDTSPKEWIIQTWCEFSKSPSTEKIINFIHFLISLNRIRMKMKKRWKTWFKNGKLLMNLSLGGRQSILYFLSIHLNGSYHRDRKVMRKRKMMFLTFSLWYQWIMVEKHNWTVRWAREVGYDKIRITYHIFWCGKLLLWSWPNYMRKIP